MGRVAIGNDGSDGDPALINCLAVIRPNNRSVVRGIAGIRELEEQVELDWLLRETGPELFKEEIGRLGFAFLVGQVMLGGNRKNLITPRLFQSSFIGETERIVALKRFGCKPDGRRFCVD